MLDSHVKRCCQLKFKKLEKDILRVLKTYGTSKNQVEQFSEEFANRNPKKGVNYYYYNGPLDDKTRSFCKLMLKIDKVFTEEEIQKISDELNYPVLEYKGSFNCRHQWVKFRGRVINTPPPTVREIRKLITEGIEYNIK